MAEEALEESFLADARDGQETLGDGQLERAVASTRVLDSFKLAPKGALIAAHAVTDASDYLVWIDLQTGSLVAAFSDARAYFAG